jgi:DNA-binding GntR family transcriptional regulator
VAGNKKHQNAKLVALNRELHFSMYRKAHSPRRLKLIEQLWLHSARYQRMSLDFRHDASDAEHRKIVNKLRRGDHEGAAEALRAHLQTTVDLLREGLESADVVSIGEPQRARA